MKPKTIVIVTPYYAPAWSYGGPPRVLSTLAQSFSQKGIRVKIITTDSLGSTRSHRSSELRQGVRIYRFKTLSNFLSFHLKLFYLPGILAQSQSILDSADLVLFSDVRGLLNWQIFPYLLKRGIPYGVFLFGQVDPGEEGVKSLIKKLFDYLWVKKYIAGAKWLFAQTQHEKLLATSILKANPEAVHLSLLPIVPVSPVSKSRRLAFRKRYSIKETDKVLLFVGRLHYLKGVDLLIKAVSSLLTKRKDLVLVIVGRDDGVEQRLHSLIPASFKKRIIFTGPLYEKEARVAYSASDIFVFTPRFYEETSTAALEALANGIPVITTKQADLPFLEQYGAGRVITNSKSCIIRAISKMQDENNAKEISKNAKRLITEKYICTKVVSQLLEVINLN